MNIVYKIECFDKKSDGFIKSIKLSNRTDRQFRKILGIKSKNMPLDGIKVDKKLKVKLESKFNIKIDIRSYDCFFSETKKKVK